VGADHRARRMTDPLVPPRRTLDPAPAEPPPPAQMEKSDLLETPPAQDSAEKLNERQSRWFRLREVAIKAARRPAATANVPAENPSDPKG
jgi:hypothetical protein